MRSRFIVLSLLLLSVFAFSIGAASAQTTSNIAQESDDLALGFSMTILDNGDEITDSFEDQVGTRIYGFHGSAGDEVTITMVQLTDDLDPFLVLLGPRGELIAMNDDVDYGGGDYSSAIEDVELPVDGSYIIIASSFQNIDAILEEVAGDQEYELTLSGNTDPVNDPTYNDASLYLYTGNLESGVTVEGSSTEEEPVYYYMFMANEGDTFDFVIDDADFDTVLHLYDPEGRRVAINNDVEPGNPLSEIRDFEIPTTGSYLLMATDVFFYSAGDPNATLEFTGGEFTLSMSESGSSGGSK